MPIRTLLGVMIEVLSDWQIWVGAAVFLGTVYLIRQVTVFDKQPRVRIRMPEEPTPPGKGS
ncbi:MAG TPA: hypothetical protein PLG79_03380 [Spirochaetales bacterium]|nr:hypothetical protein [Spirochaetales bacterium]HOV37739.1 hypothetical protein [Spirochaetales bacterium]